MSVFHDVPERAHAWRAWKYPETADAAWIMAKATEELGEVSSIGG